MDWDAKNASPKELFYLKHFGMFVRKDPDADTYWITRVAAHGMAVYPSYQKDIWTVWNMLEELVAKKVTVLAATPTEAELQEAEGNAPN